ncbi:helix-turn-helix domain-containing protein [Salinisphaera sp. Q1T1-3]|uniref:helix-turn-helix domain-containing protein n=1 Tax=Salinisphaera sp. Q1T1-3 TaxID=2321229 RepID=UPI000E76CCE3|nr:helix-turn-helix domain-containing protein [Salinisphaera sp. Q1T1-3]RJS93058.1 transcriptional regulator [Salinisphaera sp. Q1T1-3]
MKKISAAPNERTSDRHPADIKADLEKAGWSLRRLSVHHGFKPQSLAKALYQQWPGAERLIAAAIDQKPEDIWPSRYTADGVSRRAARRRSKVITPTDNI